MRSGPGVIFAAILIVAIIGGLITAVLNGITKATDQLFHISENATAIASSCQFQGKINTATRSPTDAAIRSIDGTDTPGVISQGESLTWTVVATDECTAYLKIDYDWSWGSYRNNGQGIPQSVYRDISVEINNTNKVGLTLPPTNEMQNIPTVNIPLKKGENTVSIMNNSPDEIDYAGEYGMTAGQHYNIDIHGITIAWVYN